MQWNRTRVPGLACARLSGDGKAHAPHAAPQAPPFPLRLDGPFISQQGLRPLCLVPLTWTMEASVAWLACEGLRLACPAEATFQPVRTPCIGSLLKQHGARAMTRPQLARLRKGTVVSTRDMEPTGYGFTDVLTFPCLGGPSGRVPCLLALPGCAGAHLAGRPSLTDATRRWHTHYVRKLFKLFFVPSRRRTGDSGRNPSAPIRRDGVVRCLVAALKPRVNRGQSIGHRACCSWPMVERELEHSYDPRGVFASFSAMLWSPACRQDAAQETRSKATQRNGQPSNGLPKAEVSCRLRGQHAPLWDRPHCAGRRLAICGCARSVGSPLSQFWGPDLAEARLGAIPRRRRRQMGLDRQR